eukprot:COSAG01_NODE_9428_length_2449_cov_1.362128_1_plen_71_part_00
MRARWPRRALRALQVVVGRSYLCAAQSAPYNKRTSWRPGRLVTALKHDGHAGAATVQRPGAGGHGGRARG